MISDQVLEKALDAVLKEKSKAGLFDAHDVVNELLRNHRKEYIKALKEIGQDPTFMSVKDLGSRPWAANATSSELDEIVRHGRGAGELNRQISVKINSKEWRLKFNNNYVRASDDRSKDRSSEDLWGNLQDNATWEIIVGKTREEVKKLAQKLAWDNKQAEEGIEKIYWIPATHQIRLVEISRGIEADKSERIQPFYFRATPPDIELPSAIALVSQEEYDQKEFPEGWNRKEAELIFPA